jgi:hypothetical protein
MAFLAASLCGVQMLAAQTPTTSVPSVPAHKPAHPHKPPVASKAQSSTPPAAPTAPEPELPKWPVNEKPLPATVTWDSQGLRIDATNSSLAQILADVSTATGATVEGFDIDQRVFGVYGPGPARDVISQLLQGSGYNVLLVGDQGQGTPRLIVLSLRHAGTKTAAVNPTPAPANDEDSDTEEQPQLAAPRVQPAFPAGRQPRTPQQLPQPGQPQPGQPQPGQPPSNPQN